jgi:hypothetical protein
MDNYSNTDIINSFVIVRDASRRLATEQALRKYQDEETAGMPGLEWMETLETQTERDLKGVIKSHIKVLSAFFESLDEEDSEVDPAFLCDSLSDHDIAEVGRIALKDVLLAHFRKEE